MAQRVAIPDALSAGVLDLRDYGEGQVEVRDDDEGRYVDVDSDRAAEAVADAYDGAYIRRGEADEEPDDDEEKPPTDGEVLSVEGEIERGTCPWCDEYEGEHVGQHASSAHPDEWEAYSEDS